MDLDGLMGSSTSGCSTIRLSSLSGEDDWRNKELLGFGLVKQGRLEEQGWKCTNVPGDEAMLVPQTMESSFVVRSSPNSGLGGGEQMLSFSSSPKQDNLMPGGYGSLTYYHLPSSPLSHSSTLSYSVSAPGSRSYNLDLNGPTGGCQGVFTPSQWMELENQAVIYKCLDTNAPIPPSLLISIQKSFMPIGYGAYSAASLHPTFGWGSFPLGLFKGSDQEPGRCRRTDGKKWRCSRDAVADQKYCERHLNRGRHRSRKPVEGQSGHDNVMPSISSPAASTMCDGGWSNNVTDAQKEMKRSMLSSAEPSSTLIRRTLINKEKLYKCDKKPFENYLAKAGICPISSKSHVNRSGSFYSESRNFVSSDEVLEVSDQEPHHNSIKHFIDNWSKNQSDRSNCIWPEVVEPQHCISIPKISSDISSQSQEDMILSSHKKSQDSDLIHLGLGGGDATNDLICKQASSAPNSWEAPIGGPLGEVLNINITSRDISRSSNE